MDLLDNIKAFLATAQTGSFSAAARQAGVAPSVITKRVNQLEWKLQTRLFERTTRKVALTEGGENFLPRFRKLIAEFDETLQGASGVTDTLAGHIRVKVPTTIGLLYLGKMLAAFQQQHPRITLEVVLIDKSVNPIEEGFDIAIGALTASYGNVVDEPLCPYPRIACAAPSYLARKGMPSHPTDLVGHDCLTVLPIGSLWTFTSRRGAIQVGVTPAFSSNDSQLLLAAAQAGNGITILAKHIVVPLIQTGDLVPVLQDFPIADLWLKALIPVNRVDVPRVRALMSWLKSQILPIPPWE